MRRTFILVLLGIALFTPSQTHAAPSIVCNGFDEIHCGPEYGNKVIKCYSGTTGLQVDCNNEFLASKCEEAVNQQPPHLSSFSDDRTGIMCPSGALLGCFTSPPPPDMNCGTPLDETHLVNCSMTPAQMSTACVTAGPPLPALNDIGVIGLVLTLAGTAFFAIRSAGSNA
jgi:hypothetical protein